MLRVLLALALLRASAALAQSDAPAAPDSAGVLRRARAAQHAFESFRRAHLPAAAPGTGHCDERIGRFCYWYDPYPDDTPEESPWIAEARGRLLDELARAADQLPGDDWLLGQRVRYLVEAGLADSATALAAACGGTAWRCAALEGFSRHAAHDEAAADAAFARALDAMPPEHQCLWTDLSRLLEGGPSRYGPRPCAGRRAAADSIWWLARPLYSREGNDLRTEHYARHTMAMLLERAESVEGTPWAWDQREIIVRYGMPTRWSRPVWEADMPQLPPVVGHEPAPSFWLFPRQVAAAGAVDVADVRWEPSADHPPARYALPYAVGFTENVRAQMARFRREDSMLTVAAYDLAIDSILASHPAEVRLAVTRDPDTPAALSEAPPPGPQGVVAVRSAWAPAVVSLEAVATDTAWVARRRALAPPDLAALATVSDLLFFRPGNELPDALGDALDHALPSVALPRASQLGVYWELYRAPDEPPASELAISLTVARARDRRDVNYPLGRQECAPPAEASITLAWTEPAGATPSGAGRSVVLDLHVLPPGAYVVTLATSLDGATTGCSSRPLRIVTD